MCSLAADIILWLIAFGLASVVAAFAAFAFALWGDLF
jgi:hypothetical protein